MSLPSMLRIKNRFRIKSIESAYESISDWFETPLGRRLLKNERRALSDELRYLFGYHLMQLSSVHSANLYRASRINHCFRLAPYHRENGDPAEQPQGIAFYDDLPLEDESVDVTILHHVLEFSTNPHQIIKEAARVTITRGYVIIVAFNPFGLSGLWQPFGALLGKGGIYNRRVLRAGRVADWLEFLDFSCLNTRQIFHNLPINNYRFLKSSKFIEHWAKNNFLPGMSFLMVARKDKVGLTPIRPKWEKAKLLGSIPVSKQAMRQPFPRDTKRLPKKGAVIPFPRNRVSRY